MHYVLDENHPYALQVVVAAYVCRLVVANGLPFLFLLIAVSSLIGFTVLPHFVFQVSKALKPALKPDLNGFDRNLSASANALQPCAHWRYLLVESKHGGASAQDNYVHGRRAFIC